jgi:hypothetical protein
VGRRSVLGFGQISEGDRTVNEQRDQLGDLEGTVGFGVVERLYQVRASG